VLEIPVKGWNADNFSRVVGVSASKDRVVEREVVCVYAGYIPLAIRNGNTFNVFYINAISSDVAVRCKSNLNQPKSWK